MKPKITHQEAMEFSFKAKEAFETGEFHKATIFYQKAANLESQVAEFYFDKPELEPTRSIIIRSAAFLNLKAGFIDEAQRFIFWGLLNTKDESIKIQLKNALEISISMSGLDPEEASQEHYYITLLRQKSQNYILEPAIRTYGHSVSLEMIKDFSDGYLKSFKAYAYVKFKKILKLADEVGDAIHRELTKIANPLVTSSGYSSFKFSIANDFIWRPGEDKKLIKAKSEIIKNYHSEIFTNPLTEENIIEIKKSYSDEEVYNIFKPLTKIKSTNTPYIIGYYDTNNYNKFYLSKIMNKQRKQLLNAREISKEDIGELESSLVHKRSTKGGRTSTHVIFKEQLKTAEIEIILSQIEPKDSNPILLSEEILVNMNFDSNRGFTFSFPDLDVENTDVDYHKSLEGFHQRFHLKLRELAYANESNPECQKDIDVAKRIVANLTALKDK